MDKVQKQRAEDATLIFRTKMDAGSLNDRQVRLCIKALREVLLERQQWRATAKYVKRQA